VAATPLASIQRKDAKAQGTLPCAFASLRLCVEWFREASAKLQLWEKLIPKPNAALHAGVWLWRQLE